jgi:phosphoglycolate phosphatase
MGNSGLVIFDIDGTLYDGRAATLPAVVRAFRDLGLTPPDPHEIQFFIGKTTREFHAWLGSRCAPAQASLLAAAVDRYELEYVADGAKPYPGVREMLHKVRSLAQHMAICTNGYQAYVDQVLGVHRLLPFFDRVRYPRATGDTKVRMVRELLQELAGRPALVVGDRGDDVRAAHENGIVVIAATYGYGSPQELAAADATAASPAELPDLIRALLH